MNTIAAISTASAPGGIGIVRISGDTAIEIADKVFRSVSGKRLCDLSGYHAAFGKIVDAKGEKLDDVVALVFRAPKSYTGEQTVEFSCHGGVYIARRILEECLNAGAEPAQAGEFTKRAFLNGKMDLAQAEAVMQLISANGEQALKAAIAGNSGILSEKINLIKMDISAVASHLAAWADFPEEDVPEITDEQLKANLDDIIIKLKALISDFGKGKIMREGIPTVIAGRANAGKSTLMNLLAGHKRSIVTEYEGTTRDIVEESVIFGDVILNIADTAGIRQTSDPVEKIGVEAARQKIQEAQLILAVFDSSKALVDDDRDFIKSLDKEHTIAVINKTDLESRIDFSIFNQVFSYVVYISAKENIGMLELENSIKEITQTLDFDPSSGILFTKRQQHEVKKALAAITEASAELHSGMTFDAITISVQAALECLYNLTGENAAEGIIDDIFSTFCVGK